MKFYNALNYTLGDGTHWDQPRPDVKKWLSPFSQSYDYMYGDNDKSEIPSESLILEAARKMDGNLSFVNIEHLPFDIRRSDKVKVDRSIKILSHIADRLHFYSPGLRMGFYKVPILKDVNGSVGGKYSDIVSWYEACDYLAYGGILDSVDVLYPSLYSHYPDQEHWRTFAERQIRLARKYGKPVIPFIWPQYHPKAGRGAEPFAWIPGDYWKLILETVSEHADGAVIWGHRKSGSPWDENREWWQETVKFIEG